jgi:hypothetical protein
MDHHKKPFDEGTIEKLSLYKDYLREWLPVFLPAQNAWVIRGSLADEAQQLFSPNLSIL